MRTRKSCSSISPLLALDREGHFVFCYYFYIPVFIFFFFFNDTATTEIYTLSLHDALPIYRRPLMLGPANLRYADDAHAGRSEEHTSELQSHHDLVCRLLLEKKKKKKK